MERKNSSMLRKFSTQCISLLAFGALIFTADVLAAKKVKKDKVNKTVFPHGCRHVGYSFKYFVLAVHPYQAGKPQSLYFMHNKTYRSVRLYQMRNGNEPFVMHLNNTIHGNQWGAFSSNEKEVKFICTLADKNFPKYGRVVDCDKVIELCEYTNVKFAPNNHGNHWPATSNSKTGAKMQVIYQGTLLRW